MAEQASRKKKEGAFSIQRIRPFDSKRAINVIVETPKHKRNKFRFDEKLGVFRLGKVLPAGSAFPYDFGYLPGTRAADGDPLDVLILMDESAYPGCLITARPVGVIEAEQTQKGKTIRNDRILAVADESHDHRNIQSIRDICGDLLKELEHFFISYNKIDGKEFRLLGTRGPKRAWSLIKSAVDK
jgi:inorganic pyrophosphatase